MPSLIVRASVLPFLHKKEKGVWVRDGPGKAELFRDTFLSKYQLHPGVDNQYSEPLPQSEFKMSNFYPIRERHSVKFLKALDEDSATGPDLLAARILKKCAESLGRPVAMLARKNNFYRQMANFLEIYIGFLLCTKRRLYLNVKIIVGFI